MRGECACVLYDPYTLSYPFLCVDLSVADSRDAEGWMGRGIRILLTLGVGGGGGGRKKEENARAEEKG